MSYAGLGSKMVVESERGMWKAGCRVPNVWLECERMGWKERGGRRMYQVLEYGRYCIILVGSERGEVRVRVDAAEFLKVVRLEPLDARSVGIGAEVKQSIDADGKGETEMYGCADVEDGKAFAVLVRPDCYIEHVGMADEVLDRFRTRFPAFLA